MGMTVQKATTLGTIWHLPDAMWQAVRPLLGPEKVSGSVGRPAVPFRTVLDGILWVLRTGCQWKAVPKEFGSGSTLHRRFQQWAERGAFLRLWQMMLEKYDDVRGIAWDWQCLDGVMTKAPLGGDGTGPNPTDRGKLGTKRNTLSDRRGAPLSVYVTGAQVHDKRAAAGTLDRIVVERPDSTCGVKERICVDAGYDYRDIAWLFHRRGYEPHIRHRGEEAREAHRTTRRHPARRWVVERDHSWLNRFRRLLIRWEKKIWNYQALVHFACAITVYRLTVLG
jgi:putative transposase